MTLVPVDPRNEASVLTLLQQCASWLSTAVERSDVSEVAAVKAQMATVLEATKQLSLSKEIQLDAQEMVRRAEWALGKKIREGQAEGTIRTRADGGAPAHVLSGVNTKYAKPGPTDFAAAHELTGQSGENNGIYALATASAQELSAAIEDAKTEGNLSRANVVRKVRGQRAQAPAAPSVNGIGTTRSPAIREQRADLIADLAAQGYSSRQMPAKVGVTEETVREIARTFGIEIPADRTSLKTRRINPAEVVENTATALEGLAMGIGLIDCKGVEPALASQWVDSLTESMRALNRFVRQLKEQTQ